MTNEEIDMAVTRKLHPEWCGTNVMFIHKPYSTNLEAAWEIVEKLINDGRTISLNMTYRFGKPAYQCGIYVGDTGEISDTAPKAIALCFLKLPQSSWT